MSEETKRGLSFDDVFYERPKGKNYLLTIGIDDYDHCPKLSNAVKDAKAFIELMTNRFQFEQDYVTHIFDQEATRKNIINAFRKYAEKVTDQDSLLVYYSGHGHYDDVFQEGHWIPVNAHMGEEDEYFSYTQLMKIIRAIKSHHTFMIVDSCYSGSIFVNKERGSLSDRLDRDPSRWLFASGRNEVVGDGDSGGHSPFAEHLFSALERYAGDGIWASSLIDKVVAATSYNSNQTPIGRPLQNVGDQGGQFIFRPKMDEASDWQRTQKANSEAAYTFFLEAYPQGKFSEEAAWALAKLKHSAIAYDDYLAAYPKGKYQKEALNAQKFSEEDTFWDRCKSIHRISNYRSYLTHYPQGRYVSEAEAALEELKTYGEKEMEAWKHAQAGHTIATYQYYLDTYPKGPHAKLAYEEIQHIEEEQRRAKARKQEAQREAKRKEAEKKQKQQEEEARRREAQKRKAEEEKRKAQESKNTPANNPPPQEKKGNFWSDLVSGFMEGYNEAQQRKNTPPPSPQGAYGGGGGMLNLTGNWRGSDGFVYQLNQQGNIVYCRGYNNLGVVIAEGQGQLNGYQLTLNVRNLNGTGSTASMLVAANGRQMQGTVFNQYYGNQPMSLWR